MKMNTVSYRETRSFGSYQNATVEMSAFVEDGDSAEDVLAALRQAVQKRLDERCEDYWARNEADCDIREAKRELESIKAQIKDAEAKFEAAKAFLARHGVELAEEIPF